MSVMVFARLRPGGSPPAHGAYGEMGFEMYDNERIANADAVFRPMVDGGELQRPSIEVGGVQVDAYFEGGKLVVSVHVDTGSAYPDFLNGGELPYEFLVNGEECYSSGAPLGAPEHPHDAGDYSDVQ